MHYSSEEILKKALDRLNLDLLDLDANIFKMEDARATGFKKKQELQLMLKALQSESRI